MASSTSLADVVITMALVQKYICQFAVPILMTVGTIGCISNLIVFTQKTLRKNPCSIYFIAYNCANFIYIYSSLLSLTLSLGYNIDGSKANIHVCRLRFYIIFVSNALSTFYLILASIDRILITSPNALTRQKSTCRLAYTCIVIGTLFWALYHIITLTSAIIIYVAPTISMCAIKEGLYLVHQSYYSLIKETSSVVLMIICGLWAIKNIQKISRVRVAPRVSMSRAGVGGNVRPSSSKDRQLAFMLLVDITIYTICSFPTSIFLMYYQITQYNIKSVDHKQLDPIIRFLSLFVAGIPFCISFYTNFIVSKTFRNEVKKVLSWNRIIRAN